MSAIFDAIMDALAYLLPWRAWICLMLGIIIGAVLAAYGISVIWPFDIVVAAAVFGLVVGLVWEARVA